LITFDDENQATEWYHSVIAKDYPNFPVEIYIDRERKYYQKVGFNWAICNGAPAELYLRVVKMYAITFKNVKDKSELSDLQIPYFEQSIKVQSEDHRKQFLFKKYQYEADFCQQGGDVKLDKDYKLIKIYPMESVQDRVELSEFLS